MTRTKITKLIKIAFWIGAITDAVAAQIMIFPKLRVYIFGADNFSITTEYRYALGLGAALMLGWTALLIWASLKPIERKDILILTVFPVITGIVASQVYAVSTGYISISKMIPVWIHLTALSIFYLYLYFSSNKVEN